jgi:hypothetical protein
VPAAHERPAIIDPHDNATTVANSNKRPERQGAVRRSHCRTIETFSVGGAAAAKAVTTAINAGHFRTRNLTEQQRTQQTKQFRTANEQSAHIATSAFFEPSWPEGFDGIPKPSQPNQNCCAISGKISARRPLKGQRLWRRAILCPLNNKILPGVFRRRPMSVVAEPSSLIF